MDPFVPSYRAFVGGRVMSEKVTRMRIDPADLRDRLKALLLAGGRMQMAYAWKPEGDRYEVCYLSAPVPGRPYELWQCAVVDGRLPSLAAQAPLLGWYEREMQDLYGLVFEDSPEPYPLVMYALQSGQDLPKNPGEGPAPLPGMGDPQMQLLNFGPVRADVVESAQFIYYYLGEAIAYYQPRLFFKHRGMESLFEGRSIGHGCVLAERVSGVGSLSHAWAYCQAIEDAASCEVPARAQQLRTLLAELERLYNHLHYFGHLADTTTLKVGQAEGRLLEERVKQLAALISGQRFMRNVLKPGGLRRDLSLPANLGGVLTSFREEVETYLGDLERTTSYLDRLMGTGVLPKDVAFDQGATGPIERASGVDRDLRRDHPYGAYSQLHVAVPLAPDGDALARARIRAAEIQSSFDLIEVLIKDVADGPVCAPCQAPPLSQGLGWTESPRGSLYYAVHVNTEGALARVKIKSPSFSNWRAFPFTVHQSNMMDYAINEASFGLTIAGCDR